MQITKFGHSCVLVSNDQTKVLFDPGVYSEIPVLTLDAIVITHVHADHFDIDKLKTLLENGQPKIITNTEVKHELNKHGIACEVVEQGSSVAISEFTLEAFGNEHAIIHPSLPKFQNTGYLINNKIFHPGDSLLVPNKKVEILFLPIVAPWSKISETLDYISEVGARVNFPIHDSMLKEPGAFYRFSKMWCEQRGLELLEPELGKSYEISENKNAATRLVDLGRRCWLLGLRISLHKDFVCSAYKSNMHESKLLFYPSFTVRTKSAVTDNA